MIGMLALMRLTQFPLRFNFVKGQIRINHICLVTDKQYKQYRKR